MEVSDALCHELVHHFDKVRGLLKPHQEDSTEACASLAKSEIRASLLSGDCQFTRELLRGNMFPIAKRVQICAQRRALLSILEAAECAGISDKIGLISSIFNEALEDSAPFEEIPTF
jgi:inner membrane protease ATP23